MLLYYLKAFCTTEHPVEQCQMPSRNQQMHNRASFSYFLEFQKMNAKRTCNQLSNNLHDNQIDFP